MTFDLMNALAMFQRAIMAVLRPFLNDVLIYKDDVLIKCKSFTEGIRMLDKVFCVLKETGFTVNPKKCSFFKRAVEYLGNIILVCNGSVKPSPRKEEALEKSAVPVRVNDVLQICELASYLRRYISTFSESMIPLYNLTKKDANFAYTKMLSLTL